MLGQLVEALQAQGSTSLPTPQCAVCQRQGLELTRSSAPGGVCACCPLLSVTLAEDPWVLDRR